MGWGDDKGEGGWGEGTEGRHGDKEAGEISDLKFQI
jgi:hypothetical protein